MTSVSKACVPLRNIPASVAGRCRVVIHIMDAGPAQAHAIPRGDCLRNLLFKAIDLRIFSGVNKSLQTVPQFVYHMN